MALCVRERETQSLWPLAYLVGAASKDQFSWLIELLDHSLFFFALFGSFDI